MRCKKTVMMTLRRILEFYECYRIHLKMDEEDATNKTLEAYSDFYEWLHKGEEK